MTFHLGYGTNGFSNHRLDDALDVIAGLGYTSVALTLDHHHLDPFADDLPARVAHVAARLDRLGLRCVVETGARFLLDPRRKHHPTLVDEAHDVRVDFLLRAVRVAAELNADCVSFWSGIKPAEVPREEAWRRMRSGVAAVLEGATPLGVTLGLEPEPGMFVQHLTQALRLREELGSPELLGITLDVGHCVAVEPDDAATCVRRAGGLLVNVQLDDMRPGVHEHLEFGEGELDLRGTLAALAAVGYAGVAAVELPRHSHAAPDVAGRAFDALRAAMPDEPARPRHPWLADAQRAVRRDPVQIGRLFPAAGRRVGRTAARPDDDPRGLVHGTLDDSARAELLGALATVLDDDALSAELLALYRHGDDAEKRGVLRGLALVGNRAVDAGLEIVRDALRTNDVRLVAAALGPFAAEHLDQHGWRHGVLKCLFTGVPLAAVAGLERRTDDELRRMVADYTAERTAAGRDVPADAARLLGRGM
ncbi:EboA domain-containing protein [Umezawaea beigongshangensis]|uniref:EboA domain-containing protein n=1 Tax=Umezawaea beigongshangensis TaxID=2780383 RepID=UPI0018F11B4A|nr:EboA domain-containing protein [Umezawaea beigongshangensis]